MPNPTRRPRTDPLLLTCALLPAAGLATLYSFVVRARIALGEWPAPYRPDPKDLGFDLHHHAVWVLMEAAIVSPVGVLVCLALHRLPALRGRPLRPALIAFTVGYAFLWLQMLGDPGSFLEWFGD